MSNFSAKITITAVDQVSSVTRRISSSLDALKLKTAALSSSFNNLGAASANFGRKLAALSIASVAAGVSLFQLVKKTSDVGDALAKESQRIGVAAQSLQKLQYSAELGGATIQEMSLGLKFLSKSVFDAQKGTSDQAKAFKALKINIHDANGKLKTADVVMLELADKFKSMPDGIKKTNLAMDLLGSKSGPKLIPVLNSGTAELKAQGDELERLGHIYSGDELKAAEDFNDNMTRMHVAISGVASSIAMALMPAFNDVVKGVTEYVAANKGLITQNVSSFLKNLSSGLMDVFRGIKAVISVIAPFVAAIGGIKTVVIALASVYLGSLILSFAQLVVALGAVTKAVILLGVAFFATPIGWLVAGIAAIVAAGYLIYRFWPQIKEVFISVWDAIVKKFQSVVEWMKSLAGEISAVFSTIAQAISSALSGVAQVFESIKQAVMTFADALAAPFRPLINLLGTVLNSIRAIKNGFSSIKAPNISLPSVTTGGAGKSLTSTPSAPASSPTPVASNSVQARTQWGANTIVAQAKQQQKLDVHMKIDADGRPRDVKARSDQPINFSSDTGVMV